MNNDPVNRPKYYNQGKIEVIEFIEDKGLGFHLGNVVKYICRAGKKDPTKHLEDLDKALFYLRRERELIAAGLQLRKAIKPNDMNENET